MSEQLWWEIVLGVGIFLFSDFQEDINNRHGCSARLVSAVVSKWIVLLCVQFPNDINFTFLKKGLKE